MTVLCVESGITYATGVAAIAAEGGANRTMQVSGSNSFATSVNSGQYSLGIVIIPNLGEETQDDGDINIGAQMTGAFSCAAPNSEIRNLRTQRITLTSAPNMTVERLICDGAGSDAVIFNDTIVMSNVIIHNANDSVISSATRANSSITNVTSVGATRFGFANGKFNDCVDVNSANQGYFGEMPGSGNLWEHDGSGTNTITESPVTDIFVDFAAGKYGILASSSPGAAGAGGFIQSAPPAGVSGDISFDAPAVDFSGSGSATLPQPIGAISLDIPSVEFNGTGSATFPQPSGDISFDVAPIEFSATGSASLPFPQGSVSFDVAPVEFSGTGSATIPFPVGDVNFDIPAIEFSGTGSATQPEPSGDISFDIPAIEFSATGSVTGVTLPAGEIITPRTESNVIIVDTPPNLIKLY